MPVRELRTSLWAITGTFVPGFPWLSELLGRICRLIDSRQTLPTLRASVASAFMRTQMRALLIRRNDTCRALGIGQLTKACLKYAVCRLLKLLSLQHLCTYAPQPLYPMVYALLGSSSMRWDSMEQRQDCRISSTAHLLLTTECCQLTSEQMVWADDAIRHLTFLLLRHLRRKSFDEEFADIIASLYVKLTAKHDSKFRTIADSHPSNTLTRMISMPTAGPHIRLPQFRRRICFMPCSSYAAHLPGLLHHGQQVSELTWLGSMYLQPS